MIPTNRAVAVLERGPTWNHTTYLDLAFLRLAAAQGPDLRAS